MPRLASFLILKMRAICSSESSVLLWTAWLYNPDNHTLHSHGWENLKLQQLYKI
jgi:hypothetical protein